jgi:hypothetical protein
VRIVVVDKGKQINQLKKFLQGKPTKDGIKFLDLSPNLHHAPSLNEDVNEDSEPHGEQDEASRLTQTHHQPTASTATTSSAKTRQRAFTGTRLDCG